MSDETGEDILLEGAEKDDACTCKCRCSSGLAKGAMLGFGIGVIFAFGGFMAGFVAIVCTVAGGIIGHVLKPS
jgi:hypothetical protein